MKQITFIAVSLALAAAAVFSPAQAGPPVAGDSGSALPRTYVWECSYSPAGGGLDTVRVVALTLAGAKADAWRLIGHGATLYGCSRVG
ncbi:hypothetical protein ABE522_13630 [Stenotrophomonas pennii]|uniref:hypothetical protein n=1 Tax=Stenotrophomonas lacuserhaii TaxID=2760084 RepID=UPI00320A66B7